MRGRRLLAGDTTEVVGQVKDDDIVADAQGIQQLRRFALGVTQCTKQQVLGADVVVPHLLADVLCFDDKAPGAVGESFEHWSPLIGRSRTSCSPGCMNTSYLYI